MAYISSFAYKISQLTLNMAEHFEFNMDQQSNVHNYHLSGISSKYSNFSCKFFTDFPLKKTSERKLRLFFVKNFLFFLLCATWDILGTTMQEACDWIDSEISIQFIVSSDFVPRSAEIEVSILFWVVFESFLSDFWVDFYENALSLNGGFLWGISFWAAFIIGSVR